MTRRWGVAGLAALASGLLSGLVACANEVDPADFGEVEVDEIVNPSGEEQALQMPACGTSLASFDGVDARSNGSHTGTGVGCAGVGGVANGLRYQCVELVMRYFKTKWNLRWYGNAKTLLDGAPRADVNVYDNGDGAHPPVPGDMLVWTNGSYGHVALVTEVGSDYVDIIEQNVAGNGRARLPYNGARIGSRWNGWVPAGWAHAKANTRTSGGGGTSGSSSSGSDGCAKVGVTGRVIDDDDNCFHPGGTTAYLHAESDGFANDLVWTHTTADASADNYARWNIDVARAGMYRVDVYTDTSIAEARQARYKVVHNGTTDAVTLDQTAHNGFRSLGRFQFAAGADQRVRVDDNTGEASSLRRKLVFDALRVVPACDSLRVETDSASLNVRRTASTSGELVGQLQAAAVVTRLDTVDGSAVDGNTIWHKVAKGSLVGFTSGKYLGCPP